MKTIPLPRPTRRAFSKILLLSLACSSPPLLHAQEAALIKQGEDALMEREHWAICYSGFRAGQHPDRGKGAVNPTDDQILEDLKILADHSFKLIRLYDSKENSATVLRLIEEHNLDMKVLLGAWLDAEVNNPNCPWQTEPYSEEKLKQNLKENRVELLRAVKLANKHPETVAAVAVGNEALVDWNDHMVPVRTIIAYVRAVKKKIGQPVTVADNYVWWAKDGQDLAKEVDFVSVHIYPQWEEKTIEEAISYGEENIRMVREALPESKIVITEAGWTTIASEFGDRANQDHQKIYYDQLYQWAKDMNMTTFFFEAFDEDWKGDPNNPEGAEKHWGLFTIDRKPKQVLAR